jgi:hypothetical protein
MLNTEDTDFKATLQSLSFYENPFVKSAASDGYLYNSGSQSDVHYTGSNQRMKIHE